MLPPEDLLGLMILAAGSSQRLGSPKQLLRYQGQSLLARTLKTACAASASPVFVVTGAHRPACRETLEEACLPKRWTEIYNPDHRQGMGHSLKSGIRWLELHRPSLQALIILVCDQLYLAPSHLQQLEAAAFSAGDWHLTASRYRQGWGVPALIPRRYFPQLATIDDAKGAKELLARHQETLRWIEFADGLIDIDSPEHITQYGLERRV